MGTITQNSEKACIEPLAKLILKTNSGHAYQYSLMVQQYLKKIGIDISILVDNTFNFDSYFTDSTCFDLAVIQYPERVEEHDLYKYYLEGAQYNIFGITNDMSYFSPMLTLVVIIVMLSLRKLRIKRKNN